MDRKIIDFLPQYMQDMREVNTVMTIEQPEIEGAYGSITDVLHDQFVEISTVNGVSRWERILKILPKATENLDYRKFRILLRLNEKLPYTITMLRQRLDLLCGSEKYVLVLDNDNYVLSVTVNISLQDKYLDVVDFVRNTIPANLGIGSRMSMQTKPAPLYTAMHHTVATRISIAPYLPHDIAAPPAATSMGAFAKTGMRITIQAKQKDWS